MVVVPKANDEPKPFGGRAQIVLGSGDRRPEQSPSNAGEPHRAEAISILRAVAFAERAHRGKAQQNTLHSPYIGHPRSVATILALEGGVTDVDVLCAALLHDSVGDTDATIAEIAETFGDVVAGYVIEVTDDRTLPTSERKRLQLIHASTLSRGAKLIKLAGKIASVRDVENAPPLNWDGTRRADDADWANEVMRGIGEVSSALKRAFVEATVPTEKPE